MRGYIRQRAKGTWSLTMYLGRDPETNKLRQRHATVKGTKKEAEAEMSRLIHSIETGIDFDPARLTVADYCHRWLKAVSTQVKARTAARYEELLRLHVIPVVGAVPLGKLRPLHVEKVYAEARDKGLSEQTLLHIHRVIYSALRQAVKWQLVGRNVAEAVVAPRPVKKRVKPLDPADALRVLETIADTRP
jgi:hypothetical protein